MIFPELQQKLGKFAAENATTLLTAGGVVGTVATAVLTGRASIKATKLIHKAEMDYVLEHDGHGRLDIVDKVKIVWPLYVPSVATGSATIACIVMSHRMSASRAAALAAAYGLSEGRFQEYKDKVAEKLTGPKKQAIEDEIMQDRVTSNPPDKEVIILTGGDVLCYDLLTGRYFQSSVENIKKAENAINQDMFHHQYASLSSFYEKVGLPPTNYTDEVGWNQNQDGALEVKFSATMSLDDKPCIGIDFSTSPRPDYTQLY